MDMDRKTARNIILFLVGTVVSAAGAGLSSGSNLGPSPSSALPNVISHAFDGFQLSLAVFGVQMVFFILGVALMKRNYKLIYLLCIPTLVLYSLTIGLTSKSIKIDVSDPVVDWTVVVISNIIHSLGISIQLISNLSMVPADLFVNFVASKSKKEFGAVKIAFDATLVVLAVALSLICFGELKGVGAGTIYAAFAVGYVSRLFNKLFRKLGLYEWGGHREISFKTKEDGMTE